MAILTVLAGPNGSGKTTLSRSLLTHRAAYHIDPDHLAAEEALNRGGSFEEHVAWAAEETRRRRDLAIQEGRSVSYETVMSHPSHLQVMSAARMSAMSVSLMYVYINDPDINVRRVASRVRSGGHDVPEDKIRKRYFKSLSQLMKAISIGTFVEIYENSGSHDDVKLTAMGNQGLVHLHDDLLGALQKHVPSYMPATAKFFQGLTFNGWTEFSLNPDLLATAYNDIPRRHHLIEKSLTHQ